MKKNILLLMLVMCLVSGLVGAQNVEIQYSTDNQTWYNFDTINQTNKTAQQGFLQAGTLYYLRGKDNATDWSYISQRTKQGVDEYMSSVAIAMFVLLIPTALFIVSFVGRFSANKIIQLLFSRALLALATIFMYFNVGIFANIAEDAGMNVTQELFTYMFILGWIAYAFLAYLVAGTAMDIVKEYGHEKRNKRMGGDYNE